MPSPLDLLETDRPETLAPVRALLDRARREGITSVPPPVDWRDEVLYFLLPDRFSDGQEDTRPLLTRADVIALRRATSRLDWNWKTWADAGKRWRGGTINGIQYYGVRRL